jgi:glutamate carboxypeptidase
MGDPGPVILAWLRRRTAEIGALLERLAAAESPSLAPESQRETFEILAGELDEVGFEVERVAGVEVGDHLLARPRPREWAVARGADPPQLLLGHLDTVWPLGTIERMPLHTREGRLYGPGVFDMKGGLAQMLFALRALREHELDAGLAPIVLVNSDEEIGSVESRAHIDRLAAEAARAFVLEPSFGPSGSLKTARKGIGEFTISVKGVASHAGLDDRIGASAILELSHQVQRLFELNDPARGTTVNVGHIDGGLRTNVVAPAAKAVAEVRVASADEAARIEAAIRELEPVGEATSLEVRGGFGRPPLIPTPRNRALWARARAIADTLEIPLREAAVGGASDGNFTSIHTATLDGLGAVGDGAHAEHEHVLVERLPERAALLAMLLSEPADPTQAGREIASV